MNTTQNNKKRIYIYIIIIVLLIISILGVSFAFFNYTRIGAINKISTGTIIFEYTDGGEIIIENESPINEEEALNGDSHKISFSIKAYNTLQTGMRYNVYAVYGENDPNKTRLLDSIMSLKYIPAEDGNGFTTIINNHETAKSLNFVDGKALISTGTIKNLEEEVTKNYEVYLWVDEEKIFVSSTTKRATLAEGNPSLADRTEGNVTVNRYIKNDNITTETKTIYPATEENKEKIIYTTNEYKNSYYSIKILVEATEIKENEELVYFNPDGGTINTLSKMVQVGDTYNDLPIPTKEGYTFLGWNGKNKFDSSKLLDVSTWTEEDGVYSGSIRKLYEKYSPSYGGEYFTTDFKPNTRYILNFYTKNSTTNGGIKFIFSYKDEGIESNNSPVTSSATEFKKYSVISKNGYSVKGLSISYNSSQTIWLKEIQLEEGTVSTEYEPYYVTNNVNVTQKTDHVLTAIWQKNS